MSRKLVWTESAWADYLYWQGEDRKTLKRINKLISDTLRDPFAGLGKPEPLRENLSGL
jgi:toxin YoeB